MKAKTKKRAPEIISREGKPRAVILDIDDYQEMLERLEELRDNLKEVLELCLEEHGKNVEDIPHFVGIQQIEVAV
jgi:prevent-host-death family protein